MAERLCSSVSNLKLSPLEDRGAVRIRGVGPEGATIGFTARYANQIDSILAKIPEVRARLVISGSPDVSQSLAIAPLRDWAERKRSQQVITNEINPLLRRIAGIQAVAQAPGAFGQRGSGRPVEFVIQSSGTYAELQEYAEKMLERARLQNPGLDALDTDLKLNSPEFRVEIDRGESSRLGPRRFDGWGARWKRCSADGK